MASQQEKIYQTRRQKVIQQIKGGAALFCSAEELTSDRDQTFPYIQEANFLYLTGLQETNSAILLLNTKHFGKKSILFIKDIDERQALWTGKTLGITKAKRTLKFDLVLNSENIVDELLKYLSDTNILHYALGLNEKFDDIILQLLKSKTAPRKFLPNTISDSRLITSKMRWVKEISEIAQLKEAAKITAQGLLATIPQIKTFKNENDFATALDREYFKNGATKIAFPTIVASGNNATTLHHQPSNKKINKNDLVLIDTGAEVNGYCGDISRTVPASGTFSKEQKTVYNIVLRALEAGITLAKPNKSLLDIHTIVCLTLTAGLIELGILKKGSFAKHIKDRTYSKYYMHRSGHSLGLNTHDIEPIFGLENGTSKSAYEIPLVAGNVFTIEPGLYFDENDKSVPKKYRGIGIRIEEDILITRKGCEVLTKLIPRDTDKIEALMGK